MIIVKAIVWLMAVVNIGVILWGTSALARDSWRDRMRERYPDRYRDPASVELWEDFERSSIAAAQLKHPSHPRNIS